MTTVWWREPRSHGRNKVDTPLPARAAVLRLRLLLRRRVRCDSRGARRACGARREVRAWRLHVRARWVQRRVGGVRLFLCARCC